MHGPASMQQIGSIALASDCTVLLFGQYHSSLLQMTMVAAVGVGEVVVAMAVAEATLVGAEAVAEVVQVHLAGLATGHALAAATTALPTSMRQIYTAPSAFVCRTSTLVSCA